MISHILITPPAVEPVTVETMKAHAKVSHSSDDALLVGLVRAARQWCEHYTRRAFITQSWALSIDCPSRKRSINLPRGPVLGVTCVHVYNEDDEATLWGDDNYYVGPVASPTQLVLRRGASWPRWSVASAAW